jgi:hypothetical protein
MVRFTEYASNFFNTTRDAKEIAKLLAMLP